MDEIVCAFGRRFLALCSLVCIIVIIFKFHLQPADPDDHPTNKYDQTARKSLYDRCYHIYLDVGTNIGIQIRKLYEPHLFSKRVPAIEKEFTNFFGSPGERNLSAICVFGFEPNPMHAQDLQALSNAYNKCGWPVTIFTETAVSNKDTFADLFGNIGIQNNELGASIISSNHNLQANKKSVVKVIRLSSWIENNILHRKVPRQQNTDKQPQTLMKLDIEGSELEVLPDLLTTGVLSKINKILIEWHYHTGSNERKVQYHQLEAAIRYLTQSKDAPINVEKADDESYLDAHFPLPNCNQ